MYSNSSIIMYTSEISPFIRVFAIINLSKIAGICTNKMHNVESAFVTSSIGYRAKNDPGD